MPVYRARTPGLLTAGPVLEVLVSPPKEALDAMKFSGQALPQPMSVSAMIDTGASCSVIKVGIPSQLNLKPVGVQFINTPTSQRVRCARYSIAMIFPATGGISIPSYVPMLMIGAPLMGQYIQCLLGRDFLQHGVLVYSGSESTFSFCL